MLFKSQLHLIDPIIDTTQYTESGQPVAVVASYLLTPSTKKRVVHDVSMVTMTNPGGLSLLTQPSSSAKFTKSSLTESTD